MSVFENRPTISYGRDNCQTAETRGGMLTEKRKRSEIISTVCCARNKRVPVQWPSYSERGEPLAFACPSHSIFRLRSLRANRLRRPGMGKYIMSKVSDKLGERVYKRIRRSTMGTNEAVSVRCVNTKYGLTITFTRRETTDSLPPKLLFFPEVIINLYKQIIWQPSTPQTQLLNYWSYFFLRYFAIPAVS